MSREGMSQRLLNMQTAPGSAGGFEITIQSEHDDANEPPAEPGVLIGFMNRHDLIDY
jgi:hypothetical protein